jgi:DNA-binding HxlR family transcriptional regulator
VHDVARTELSARQAAEETRQVLRGDWDIAVVTALAGGPRRFNELLAEINAVEEQVGRRLHRTPLSNRVLSQALTRMADDGLLLRHSEADTPYRFVWYQLTAVGYDLIPVLHAMAAWAQRHNSGHRRPKPATSAEDEH